METIFDCPGYRIYKPYEGRKFSDGEIIAIPYNTSTHGVLYTFYTLGTVAGYAVRNGEDPFKAVARAIERKHDLYYAFANGVVISNPPQAKVERPGFNLGDEIILQGHRFRIDPAPNQNIKLTLLGEA